MDPEALSHLLSPTGWTLLGSLPPYEPATADRISERLRKEGFEPALVAAVLTQSRLRTRARTKLADFADGMLFTPEGLEQATRLVVAARHAQRYRDAGATRVADLTCGLGVDALALAGMGLSVLAVEIDELTAALATVNLRHFPHAEVRHADSLTLDLAAEGVEAIFADPARRTRSGARRHDPSAYSPSLDHVLALRSTTAALGVKVGPGIPHRDLPSDAEAQWVSVDGDVVEAGLWFGPLAPEGPGRSALVLRSRRSAETDGDPAHEAHEIRGAGTTPRPAPVGAVGTYLSEPDGAVIRAGLVAEVAERVEGRLIDASIAYVTTDTRPRDPLLTTYRVLDELPFGVKRLRAYLRDKDVGRLTIKKRGTAVVPEELRGRLALKGAREATVVLTRVAGAQRVLVVEPVDQANGRS